MEENNPNQEFNNYQEQFQTQPDYNGQQGQTQNTVDERKGLSIASMVLGIISLALFCLWYVSIPCGILGIVFGLIGKNRAGKNMAITGFVTGLIAVALWLVSGFFIFLFGFASGVAGTI